MTNRSILLATSLALLVPLAVGCARRPAGPLSSAPAPSAAAGSSAAGGSAAADKTPGTATGTAAMAAARPSDAASGAAAAAAAEAAAAARPAPAEYRPIDALPSIHFDFDRADIRPVDRPVLDLNATWMKQHGDTMILIEGHADERGTNAYNLALGQRRAEATRNYLVAQGVKADRFALISYGEERPLCTEHTEACWARNRRAQFLVKSR